MVHTNLVSAAVSAASSNWPFRPRVASTGSFQSGDITPTFDPYERADPSSRQRSAASVHRPSISRYHTFPTSPPKAPSENTTLDDGEEASSGTGQLGRRDTRRRGHGHGRNSGHSSPGEVTPLPLRQVGLLAILSLAEQTALNSIGPYLPTMVSSFPEIPKEQMGLYVGLLASAFAMAQLTTNLFWGYLSDIVGRKPVILTGSSLLMLCFGLFGFCTRYWQVVVIHIAMGLLNGNAAVVPTCLGEVTDRTNQSSVFAWLPVIYSLGSITGPALGGLLVASPGAKYPFLGPNIAGAVLLGLAVTVLAIWFDETLESVGVGQNQSISASLSRFFSELSPAKSATGEYPETESLLSSPQQGDDPVSSSGDRASNGGLKSSKQVSVFRQLLNYKTVLLLLTYLVFQLSNISFNSLYPIFASAAEPTGRNLPPEEIGLLLSFAGLATIFFQILVFQSLRTKMGNLGTYRVAFFGLAVSGLVMPWVGHKYDRPLFGIASGEWWLYGEMAAVLVVKNICAVGGLSSVMLLITNSAPSNETLGTLNGIAQTLSAAGRSVGPFVSGALFTLSTRLRPKGELLAWWIFGGVAVFGWLGGLMVSGRGLESADWQEDDEDDEPIDEEIN
ncbi:major facilitator superfamily transporter [Grosmannia clavigera kw1407]|uniref:Major facilitator superfamily transporter n=1 Tax=Grosmannia clavigera (strain kw1407 / UAMH 11150) TaxID=655863 RepID=F0XKA9_GROCL|nr:major facilitator superfamily transporter [Grosmannia clavigera kw1407]EFX01911.1 major facilitator superfamily transporter [Grosmannia clavigera kw1407]